LSRNSGDGVVRGLSNLTWDRPESQQRIIAGDLLAGSGPADPLGGGLFVAGVAVQKQFDLDPYVLRSPLPRLDGTAFTPSTLEVYVDGRLVRREQIAPGPFTLAEAAGAGRAVRRARGGSRCLRAASRTLGTSSYIHQRLLRKGLSDYSYSAGFRRPTPSPAASTTAAGADRAPPAGGGYRPLTLGARFEAARSMVSGAPRRRTARLRRLELVAAASRQGRWAARRPRSAIRCWAAREARVSHPWGWARTTPTSRSIATPTAPGCC